jgi:divalent metal cation (Fe/Co/Zn/Cd) transporter
MISATRTEGPQGNLPDASLHQAIRLEIVTLVWMVIEAVGAVGAAWLARSLLLLAFGIDSGIELISAVVLLWRLRKQASGSPNEERDDAAERTASRIAGCLLYVLAFYVVVQAVWGLWKRNNAEPSILGIFIAVVAAVGMPILARRKLQVAAEIGSAGLRADATETITCGYFAWASLGGLLLNQLFRWWWIDSLAALLIVPLLLREAKLSCCGSVLIRGSEKRAAKG